MGHRCQPSQGWRVVVAWLGLILVACGGAASDPAPIGPTVASAPVERGTLLQDTFTAYPRLVRLAHQPDAARNGRIVASVTQTVGAAWMVGLHASDDDGRSFTPLGAIVDPVFNVGLCCGSLFELPQTVGALPPGTLLYAAAVGGFAIGEHMTMPIYRSADGGATFERLAGATCGRSAAPRAPNYSGPGVWEPEFFIAGDGSLACIYSDESEPGRSQVLKLAHSLDGMSWSVPRVVVAGPSSTHRPGMAVVRRLPTGSYSMSFEVCGPQRCEVRWKLSSNGLDWGPLGSLGTRPQTAQGQHFRHAPTHIWMPHPESPHGMLALVGQILMSDTIDVEHNGRSLLINTSADGSGDWQLIPAPIGLPVAPGVTNWCQNYSTALLPSATPGELTMMLTDGAADSSCRARFGRGTSMQAARSAPL
jgi:hypothetical protein